MSRTSIKNRKRSSKNRRRQNQKFCVGDKLLVSYFDQELQGVLHFHGPVNDGKKGLIDLYGIELGEGEGESDGKYNQSERVYFSPSTTKSAVFLKQRNILQVLTPINGKRLSLNDRVMVRGRGKGTIKFIGPTYFGPHLWYGIHLDKKLGRSDGMVQSVRYFACPVKHGVFIREEKLTPLDKSDRPINLLSKFIRKSRQEMAADLFEACAKGDIKVVRQILTVDKSVAGYARDNNTDATALMTSCYHGYYQVAQELLQTRKININEQNYHGMSALHMAAQAGYDKIVELLIKYGIDYDATTEDGVTALFNAVENFATKQFVLVITAVFMTGILIPIAILIYVFAFPVHNKWHFFSVKFVCFVCHCVEMICVLLLYSFNGHEYERLCGVCHKGCTKIWFPYTALRTLSIQVNSCELNITTSE